MATSTIKQDNPSLGKLRLSWSRGTDYAETGNNTLVTLTLNKRFDNTYLYVMIGGFMYTDALSATFSVIVDGVTVGQASTTRTNDVNAYVTFCGYANGISAGNHSVSLITSTQGSNMARIPAWCECYATVTEIW